MASASYLYTTTTVPCFINSTDQLAIQYKFNQLDQPGLWLFLSIFRLLSFWISDVFIMDFYMFSNPENLEWKTFYVLFERRNDPVIFFVLIFQK